MNITASSVYDLKTIKTFMRISMFRLLNPKVAIISSNAIALLAVLFITVLKVLAHDTEINFLLVVALFMLLYMDYMYFIMPNRRYKAIYETNQVENHLTFYDDHFKIESSSDVIDGMNTVKYSAVYSVMEIKEYFYIYINKSQGIIVEKATIQGGSVEDIREVLRKAVGKKYRIRKC